MTSFLRVIAVKLAIIDREEMSKRDRIRHVPLEWPSMFMA
jgi:hypothetical protein